MALLRTAGGNPSQTWAPDQDELTETLWAEMGLGPDAHITLVSFPNPSLVQLSLQGFIHAGCAVKLLHALRLAVSPS